VLGHVVGRETVHGLTLVTLAGELDVATVAELHRHLAPSDSAASADVAVDMREVTFIDCAVVGTLVGARNRAVEASACLRLSGLRAQPRRVLTLCALDDVFCVYRHVDDAAGLACAAHPVADSLTTLVPAQRTPDALSGEDPGPGRSGTDQETDPGSRPRR
jgi:anti-sigma B factor antagonist